MNALMSLNGNPWIEHLSLDIQSTFGWNLFEHHMIGDIFLGIYLTRLEFWNQWNKNRSFVFNCSEFHLFPYIDCSKDRKIFEFRFVRTVKSNLAHLVGMSD